MIYRDHFCIMFLSPHIVQQEVSICSFDFNKKRRREKIKNFFHFLLSDARGWKCFLFIFKYIQDLDINLCKSSWVLGWVNEVLFNVDNEERPRFYEKCAYALVVHFFHFFSPFFTSSSTWWVIRFACIYEFVFFYRKEAWNKRFFWLDHPPTHQCIKLEFLQLLLTFLFFHINVWGRKRMR